MGREAYLIEEISAPKGERFVYCNHCGTEMPNDSRFCSNCGRALARTASGIGIRSASSRWWWFGSLLLLIVLFGIAYRSTLRQPKPTVDKNKSKPEKQVSPSTDSTLKPFDLSVSSLGRNYEAVDPEKLYFALSCNGSHCFPPKVSPHFPAAFSDSFPG
jgi:predicted nucleic acid-binding Zn ribbon protein